MDKDIYQQLGYINRRDYLEHIAEQYVIDKITVFVLAHMLGKEKDFDKLVDIIRAYVVYYE